MSVLVRVPTPLRRLTGEQDSVTMPPGTLQQGIEDLEARFPGMRERLCDEQGELRRFVNIFVNGEDVRFLDGLATKINTGDEVSIVPAVAGG